MSHLCGLPSSVFQSPLCNVLTQNGLDKNTHCGEVLQAPTRRLDYDGQLALWKAYLENAHNTQKKALRMRKPSGQEVPLLVKIHLVFNIAGLEHGIKKK